MTTAVSNLVLLISFSSISQAFDVSGLSQPICQASTNSNEVMMINLQSEIHQLRAAVSGLQIFQDREEIQETIAEWRVLMDAAANFRGPDYMNSNIALQLKRHYWDYWAEGATLTVTSETGSPVNITGRFTLLTLWDDDGSFRHFQSNQRIINGLHTVEVSRDRCTAVARGSLNAFYDAYSTTATVPGAPVVGVMTPFNMAYYFERCSPVSGEHSWRINRVEMIADFFAVLAPEGYDWNNCGRVDIPNLCAV